jgi:hypothetical protein
MNSYLQERLTTARTRLTAAQIELAEVEALIELERQADLAILKEELSVKQIPIYDGSTLVVAEYVDVCESEWFTAGRIRSKLIGVGMHGKLLAGYRVDKYRTTTVVKQVGGSAPTSVTLEIERRYNK